MTDSSIPGMVDDLGGRLGAPKAERPKQIQGHTFRLRKASVWPPDVFEEVRKIYAGEIE